MDLSLFDIGSIIAFCGLVISLVKLYLDQRKARKDIELTKEYIHTFSKLVESNIKAQEDKRLIDKQKFEWQKLKDVGKALWELATTEDETAE